jgi:Arc/MetJ-type ribon-helix-helix transcriptional regulator
VTSDHTDSTFTSEGTANRWRSGAFGNMQSVIEAALRADWERGAAGQARSLTDQPEGGHEQ